MKTTIKEQLRYCPNCAEQTIKQVFKETEDEVDVTIYKCTNCGVRPTINEVWQFEYKNQDNL